MYPDNTVLPVSFNFILVTLLLAVPPKKFFPVICIVPPVIFDTPTGAKLIT